MSKEKLRLILKILLGVSAVMIVLSAYEIFDLSEQYKNSIRTYDQLEEYVTVETVPAEEVKKEETPVETTREIVVEEVEAVPEYPHVDFEMDFPALKEINSDLVGWIYYEPIEISYPVVIDKGNDYYEHYSFDLKRNVAGAIFMDYACRADLNSFNTIIYGHGMRNGTMFGRLINLIEDPSIPTEHPYFYVFTENETRVYKIFAAYLSRIDSPTYDIKMEYTMEDKQAYMDYINECATYRDEEFFANGITEDTKIATLSTCHGYSGDRTVIHGVLVAEEER